ncbi:DUF928 domain-containing protein [Almyronema epifaneia]|uniref:DUF928 domain-containing protein n=1 Tax=Almyronema epifaneia S1 TaxID=2991925 RepID=A0ABW6IEE0_9CYAN
MAGLNQQLPQKQWLRLLATGLMTVGIFGWVEPEAKAVDVIGRIRQIFGGDTQQGGATGRSRGGAIRDEYCIYRNAERDPIGRTLENLVALLPTANIGQTTKAYPAFWFYVPVGQNADANHAQFDLLDGETLEPIFTRPIRFELPETPGIVGFSLPESSPPLQIGKNYIWFFSVECSEVDASRNPVVFGEIERVEASAELNQQLATTPDAQDYGIYAEFGLVYEMLTSLVEHRQANAEVWQFVLEANELSQINGSSVEMLTPYAFPAYSD